jgi:hypothetical protein
MMLPQTVARRVDALERKMGRWEELPDRMTSLESQIVQFRADVGVEFSAVRSEMGMMEERLRREMVALNSDTLTQVRILHEDMVSRFALLEEHWNGPKRSRRDASGGRRRKKN